MSVEAPTTQDAKVTLYLIYRISLLLQQHKYVMYSYSDMISARSTGSSGSNLHAYATPFTTTQQAIPRPIFLDDKDQDIDDHPLHCSICCDVSFNPVITPCQHVFCRDCIENGLRSSLSCPNDRRPLNQNALTNISGLHDYIYNRTLVQCPKCDKWTGQFQQYKVHVPTCTTSPYVQSLERKLQDLQLLHGREMTNKQSTIDALQAALAQERLVVERNAAASIQSERERLQNVINTLQNEVALQARITSMGPVFNTNYQYDEDNASDLSRIISRSLFNKPAAIDSNRIFNCVKRCYDGALRDNSFDVKL